MFIHRKKDPLYLESTFEKHITCFLGAKPTLYRITKSV